jgi:hypothetical protein
MKEYYVVLVNDYASSNYTTEFCAKAIIENVTIENIRHILANMCDDWAMDDEEGIELIEEFIPELMEKKFHYSPDYELAIKIEKTPFYKF